MSSDLAKVGDKFTISFKQSKLSLTKVSDFGSRIFPNIVTAYASNKFAKSPFISLMGILSVMGFPREVQSNLAGLYKANIKDGVIEFNLDREIK